MNYEIDWLIEPFNSAVHKRDDFVCGYAELDTYIRQYANQDTKKKIAQIFVALVEGNPAIKGYYTISAASFDKAGLPIELAKRLPHKNFQRGLAALAARGIWNCA